MMRFSRVREPAGFQAAVQNHCAAVQQQINDGGEADFEGRESWKSFKSAMAPATFGKCGYCEVNVVAVDRFKGDVEHYRPKGRVDELIMEPDGSVRSKPLFASGYHWLAYSWTNYILTCNPCNSAYKRNFFPLRVKPAAAPVEGDENGEVALLLSPFGRKDPSKHLIFDNLGVVGSRKGSAYGRATIAVCGLSRSALEKKRRHTAELLQRFLDVLGDAAASPDAIDLALQSIADLGMADKEHCGMVRGMFTEATGHKWSYVEEYAPRPAPRF
jgi:hypothetical protein